MTQTIISRMESVKFRNPEDFLPITIRKYQKK